MLGSAVGSTSIHGAETPAPISSRPGRSVETLNTWCHTPEGQPSKTSYGYCPPAEPAEFLTDQECDDLHSRRFARSLKGHAQPPVFTTEQTPLAVCCEHVGTWTPTPSSSSSSCSCSLAAADSSTGGEAARHGAAPTTFVAARSADRRLLRSTLSGLRGRGDCADMLPHWPHA